MASSTTQYQVRENRGPADLFTTIRDHLGLVEQRLRAELQSDAPFVDELLRYGCLLGGKRLRPAILLLAAQATGEVNEEHYVLGAVVEMIHTATLVHDDVLDDADQRRHLPTVNSRWDNSSSVLLGDFLFTHAFYLASTVGSTLACRTIGRATNIVCEGELRQIGSRGNFFLSEDEYLEIIESKTAELCSCSTRLGANYAGADPATIQRLSNYGRYVGIAFQIADDLLDVTGTETSVGKSLGTDLRQRKATLPLIHVMQSASVNQRRQVVELLESPRLDARELLDWMDQFGALEYSEQVAKDFADKAKRELANVSDSAATRALLDIADFVVSRRH